MIVPDVNLLYAEIDAFPQHRSARGWWEDLLSGDRAVGIAPVALFGFLRIATSRRVFSTPLTVEDAIGRVGRWLEQPNVTALVPGSEHLTIAFRLLQYRLVSRRIRGFVVADVSDVAVAELPIMVPTPTAHGSLGQQRAGVTVVRGNLLKRAMGCRVLRLDADLVRRDVHAAVEQIRAALG